MVVLAAAFACKLAMLRKVSFDNRSACKLQENFTVDI